MIDIQHRQPTPESPKSTLEITHPRLYQHVEEIRRRVRLEKEKKEKAREESFAAGQRIQEKRRRYELSDASKKLLRQGVQDFVGTIVARPDLDEVAELATETPTFAYNSETLQAAIDNDEIPLTLWGLLNGMFLAGTTNLDPDWRDEVEDVLESEGIISSNPNMKDNWNPRKHTIAEALAMDRFTLIAMYVENAKGTIDGGLGSIVEMSMAAALSLLHGQRVLIAIAPGFRESLQEPGAIAQYEAVLLELAELKIKHPDLVEVVLDCSRETYTEKAIKALREQNEAATARSPISEDMVRNFEQKRDERLAKKNLVVVQGGSSKPYSNDEAAINHFNQAQSSISKLLGGTSKVERLNSPPYSDTWLLIDVMNGSRTWESLSDTERAMFTRQKFSIDEWNKLSESDKTDQIQIKLQAAFLSEQGLKDRADILLWMMPKEAVSKAAISEIGFMIINALMTGQQLCILLEGFDEDVYVRDMLRQHSDALKLQFPDLTDLHTLLDKLDSSPNEVTFKAFNKIKALQSTPLHRLIANARRTRNIATAQLNAVERALEEVREKYRLNTDLVIIARTQEEYNAKVQALQASRQVSLQAQTTDVNDVPAA